ncbi:MAG: kinase/pyrophosphorylase [Coriobacteriia bacterium]|nr:kinase/pyrophosphorylase [Coriobacteriia bacterium]
MTERSEQPEQTRRLGQPAAAGQPAEPAAPGEPAASAAPGELAASGRPHHFTLHILSDSLGQTAETFARVLASRFPALEFSIERSSLIGDPAELELIARPHCFKPNYLFVYTFARQDLLDKMEQLSGEGCQAVDLLGHAVRYIHKLSGERPTGKVGAIHSTGETYFQRIDAMEYTIDHDDGRHPEGLLDADIVLIGVSRSGKSPLSTFLAYQGWKVANLPLAFGSHPPDELFEVDPRRIYGLMTTPEVLLQIRESRSVELGMHLGNYTSRESIERELADARDLMRRLGCIVINTANRAIEEVAQDILRYVLILDPKPDL